MRVITLPPTNALLVAHGYQTIITRPTDTNYRGYVAIYAAKELSDLDRSLMAIYPFTDCLARVGDSRVERGWDGFWRTTRQMGWASTIESNPKYAKEIEDGLPKGAIVGVAWLAKTQNAVAAYANWNRREDVETLDDEADYNDVPRWEPSFGDFSNGQRAWWLTRAMPLRTPITITPTGTGTWDTEEASARDGHPLFDVYESFISKQLVGQGESLPNEFDPGMWRLVNRRGTTLDTRPKNL